MKIGYARVSTQEQNLDSQVDALHKAGAEKVYTEKVTGTKKSRPELERLVDYAREGDTIVVYKLDRLGRSLKNMLGLTELFEERGIQLQSIQDGFDTNTATGKAMFRMLAVLSEMERDIIAERTRAGLTAARARGRKGGRPKKNKKDIEKALKLYHTQQYSVKEITEMTGVGKTTIYRALKETS